MVAATAVTTHTMRGARWRHARASAPTATVTKANHRHDSLTPDVLATPTSSSTSKTTAITQSGTLGHRQPGRAASERLRISEPLEVTARRYKHTRPEIL